MISVILSGRVKLDVDLIDPNFGCGKKRIRIGGKKKSAELECWTPKNWTLGFGACMQSAHIGRPTGNGKELSNSQACCLAQLCLAAA